MTPATTKQTLLMLAGLLLKTSLSLAGIMGEPNDLSTISDGFYIGVDIGLSNLFDKEQHLINPESSQLGNLGVIGGGYVGYDYSITEQFKIGIEAFGNASNLHISTNHYTPGTAYTINSTYNAGLRLLPGFQFTTDSLAHIIIGYANARFNIQDTGNNGYLDAGYNKSGFQSGLGWTTNLTQSLIIRLDALYTTYGSQSSTGTSLANSTSPFQYYTNDFSTVEADLSVMYKFN